MSNGGISALIRVPTGIPGFDTILGGGLFKGGLYIVQGPPGTGKTTFGTKSASITSLEAGGCSTLPCLPSTTRA